MPRALRRHRRSNIGREGGATLPFDGSEAAEDSAEGQEQEEDEEEVESEEPAPAASAASPANSGPFFVPVAGDSTDRSQRGAVAACPLCPTSAVACPIGAIFAALRIPGARLGSGARLALLSPSGRAPKPTAGPTL